jgi:cation diffusion facilitator family transporter
MNCSALGMAELQEKPVVVYAAAGANLAIAIAKFVAAGTTGNSAMMSEGLHSVADTGNELLLLLGLKRSRKPADRNHPFGYGMELYFWSFVVAMFLFVLGGGISIYEGIRRLMVGGEVKVSIASYVTLGVAFVAESFSLRVALKAFQATRRKGEHWWKALRKSKDPSIFIVIFEDSAALAGLVVATLGLVLEQRLHSVIPDGIAAIAIGIILCSVALLLGIETKNLLLGESADSAIVEAVQRLAKNERGIRSVHGPFTMHLSPDAILLNMEIDFEPEVDNPAVLETIQRLETTIRRQFPEIRKIFIEAAAVNGEIHRERLAG